MNLDKTKSFHEEQVTRASSLPRSPAKRSLPDLMTNSFSSSNSIWSPDGKCPSFADILKRGSEEALDQIEQSEVIVNTIITTSSGDELIPNKKTEEIHENTSYRENMTISPEVKTGNCKAEKSRN
jgi:hypothetical protein